MSERIRVAVVGLGTRGLWALRSLLGNNSKQFEVVAVVDKVLPRVDCARQLVGIPDTAVGFADLKSCLAESQKGHLKIDAVIIATPDGAHAEPVEEALAAGKWVFVEKPLEITEERLERIIKADEAAGGKTFVGFNLRFAPVYRAVKQLIEAGEIGRVLTVQADEFYGGGRTYFRRWNRLRSVGGGIWITKCCHDFDLIYWLTGSAPARIYANCELSHYHRKPDAALYCRDCKLQPTCPDRYDLNASPNGKALHEATEKATGQRADICLYNSDKDTFDCGQVIVKFVSGATATYTVNVVAGFSNRRLRISGTDGTIDGDLGEGTVIIRRRNPASVETLKPGTGEGHGGADEHLMSAFADFIAGKPSPLMVRPAEAAVAVRMGLAATRSCDNGQPVSME